MPASTTPTIAGGTRQEKPQSSWACHSFLVLAALLLSSIATAGCLRIRTTGDPMPSFAVEDVDGHPSGTALLKGKIIVLHLFDLLPSSDKMHAVNSKADVAIETLKKVHANFTREDVIFLSVGLASYFDNSRLGGNATEQERNNMVRGFRDRHNATWPFAAEAEPGSIDGLFNSGSNSIVYVSGYDGIIHIKAYQAACLEDTLGFLVEHKLIEDLTC